MDPRQIAAERLRQARESLEPCKPLSSEFEFGEADAYAIQRENVDRRIAGGAARVGWKVGLTSDAIQKWLNVTEPDFGALLSDMVVPDGHVIERSRLIQPRAEGEIAFVLNRDLGGGATAADVLAATEFVLPAIEIVDSRIANWKIKWADTVADNASSGMLVLGSKPVSARGLDLRLVGMKLSKNGAIVSTGAGAACLGSPVNAVAWLARTLARLGGALSAGDVVLSGALGPITPVEAGDWLDLSISTLGDVSCRFR